MDGRTISGPTGLLPTACQRPALGLLPFAGNDRRSLAPRKATFAQLPSLLPASRVPNLQLPARAANHHPPHPLAHPKGNRCFPTSPTPCSADAQQWVATVTSTVSEKEEDAGHKLALEVVDAANGSVSEPTPVNGDWVSVGLLVQREGLLCGLRDVTVPCLVTFVLLKVRRRCMYWLQLTQLLVPHPCAPPPRPALPGEACCRRGPLRLGPQGPAGCATWLCGAGRAAGREGRCQHQGPRLHQHHQAGHVSGGFRPRCAATAWPTEPASAGSQWPASQ